MTKTNTTAMTSLPSDVSESGAFVQMLIDQKLQADQRQPVTVAASGAPSTAAAPIAVPPRQFKSLADHAKFVRDEWLKGEKWLHMRKHASPSHHRRTETAASSSSSSDTSAAPGSGDVADIEWAVVCAQTEFAQEHLAFRTKHGALFDRIVSMHDVLENHCRDDAERAKVLAKEDAFYAVLEETLERKRQGQPYNRQAAAKKLLDLNCPELSVETDKFLLACRPRVEQLCQAHRNSRDGVIRWKKPGKRLCAAGQVQPDMSVSNWSIMTIDDCRSLVKTVQSALKAKGQETATKKEESKRDGGSMKHDKVETKEEWHFEDFAKDAANCDYNAWWPMLVMYPDGSARHLVVQYPWKRDTAIFGKPAAAAAATAR